MSSNNVTTTTDPVPCWAIDYRVAFKDFRGQFVVGGRACMNNANTRRRHRN